MKAEAPRRGAPEAATAKRQAQRHLSAAGRRPVQLPLGLSVADQRVEDELIPNHRLHPAEPDLRMVMNTLPRSRPHWWLLTPAGRNQRELLQRLGWWAA